MRRLYVGGLSHTVTQKDLKDRFGKFGDVQDVELRTRKDEEGVPYKTFSYINIEISDADLKKCLTVLNKSKWKGGTLQIETAKESFLHRLAQERQEAEEQRLQPPAAEDKRQKLLDSLSKAGVDNFTMKAAVPGTEIPGHKGWVVSKFGRVLPVLQIRSRKGNKARTMKYDPSKFSHNIRKLDRNDRDEPTPVNQLTWELQGGDDDISKKRRGEFPPYEPPKRKKSRTDVINSHNALGRTRSEPNIHFANHSESHQFTNGFELQTNQRWAQWKRGPFTDSDVDSDEEIRRMVAAQDTSRGASWHEVEEDNLEVVGLDYLKSGRSQQKGGSGDEDEDDYDSADTDEFFASRKPCQPSSSQEQRTQSTAEHPPVNNTDRKRKTKKKSKTEEEVEEEEEDDDNDEDSADDEKQLVPSKSKLQRRDSVKQSSERQSNKMAVLPVVKPPSELDDDDDDEDDEGEDDAEDEEESESADSCSDSDYEAMFSNVTCLEISLANLQRLAEESQETSETTVPSILNGGPRQNTNSISGPAEQHVPKKGTMPEDILAAIMADSSDDEKKKKKKKRKGVISTPLPAFQGTKTVSERSETNQKEEGGSVVKKQKLESEVPQEGQVNQTEEEEEEEVEGKKREMVAPNKAAVITENAESSSSSSSEDEVEEDDMRMEGGPKATAETKATPSSSSSASEEEDSEKEIISAEGVTKAAALPAPHSESSSSEEEEEEEQPAPTRVTLGAEEEEELQKKANMRRLAAIQQRLKEAEEHKKLIQGALANLDAPTPGAGKHIVFGSDDDDDEDDEDKQQTVSAVTTSKKTLFEDSQSEEETTSDEASANENTRKKKKVPSRPQLFGGTEDEEEGDEDEDDSRFDIRPQFEGAAGQKLMALQSRFGTDERFRMDSRFLEENEDKDEESERKSVTEEDEALEEEKKKNLSILQSILGSSQQTCSSKTPSKAKTFRDVSALHYDPSREEHAAFETKTDETKESKSARRKKREEAQKLPEVSKEIYFDVSGDLKAVFGQTKDNDAGGEEKMNWDQEEEEEVAGKKEESPLPSSLVETDLRAEKESSSGFKFSFFGDDTEPESKETDEYKVESIQAPKVSWQQDPRFHDSSEEEEEEEEEQKEDEQQTWQQSNTTDKTTEGETTSKTNLFFFFYPEDSRLTEGPRLFFRSSQLEEQREQWEERRTALRQEYRKKHKDARRKLKPSLKS